MFSVAEEQILSSIYFEQLLEACELDLLNLLIIERILNGYNHNEIIKSLHLSNKGYYKRKAKLYKLINEINNQFEKEIS